MWYLWACLFLCCSFFLNKVGAVKKWKIRQVLSVKSTYFMFSWLNWTYVMACLSVIWQPWQKCNLVMLIYGTYLAIWSIVLDVSNIDIIVLAVNKNKHTHPWIHLWMQVSQTLLFKPAVSNLLLCDDSRWVMRLGEGTPVADGMSNCPHGQGMMTARSNTVRTHACNRYYFWWHPSSWLYFTFAIYHCHEEESQHTTPTTTFSSYSRGLSPKQE